MEAVSPAVGFFLAKPRILVGESITGYTARLTAFATRGGNRMTMELMDKPGHRAGWVLPSGLEKLASLLHPGVPPAETLLREHTLYPLFRPFLPDFAAASLRTHFLGSSVRGIAATCGLLPYGISARWNRAVCLACLNEDAKSGQFHWRTSHLVPGIAMCPIHSEPLYTYCTTCASGFRESLSAWLPSTRCACGGNLTPVHVLRTAEERTAESRIAQMAGQILTDPSFEVLGHDQILLAVANRAKEFGHGGPRGVMRLQKLLAQRIGQDTLDAHQICTGRRTAFRAAVAGQQLFRNPVQNIILISGLFGSLNNFIDAARNPNPAKLEPSLYRDVSGKVVRRRLGRPDSYAKWDRMSAIELAEMRTQSRCQALEAIRTGTTLTRSVFGRTPGACSVAYKFLLRFDREWLDKVFPPRPFTSRGTSRFDTERAQLDRSLAAHVYARRDTLLHAAAPFRLTKRRLLQGHSLTSARRATLDMLTNTQRALDECVESSPAWSIRRASLLLEHAFSLSPNAPFDRNITPANLSPTQLKRLYRKIQKWCEGRAST
ncbi:TniQ family protein [Noviherbaspirillum aridicola]|uniref:TniQ family protein n=1 Tax=Noviherbaspirillum aridicola TaxID=2849687 RepID=UPI001C7E9920